MSLHKIHEDSDDSVLSQLDLFATPHTQTSVLKGEWTEVAPIRDSANGPLEFEIEGNTDHYIDLQNTFIQVQCVVKNADGSNLSDTTADVYVVPVSNFLHSLFSSMSVSLNGHETEYEANYAHRAYIEDLVNYGSEAKRSHLQTSLWMEDGCGVNDTVEIAARQDDYNPRREKIKNGKVVEMIGRLHGELFHQPRYLIPNCSMKIKLLRSDPSFCLLKTHTGGGDADAKYKIDIIKCEMLVRKVQIHPSVVASHNALMSNGSTLKYPVTRVDTQFFSISQGRQNERINLLINRQIPKRLIFALVDHQAQNGSYTRNPFKFHHFDLSSVQLTIDGHPVPNKPIRLDFNNDQYTRAYLDLALTTGKAFVDEGNAITREQFASGHTLLAFDLTGDLCENGVHLVKQGTTTLELTFRVNLPSTVSLLMYTENTDLITIDSTFTVTRASKV